MSITIFARGSIVSLDIPKRRRLSIIDLRYCLSYWRTRKFYRVIDASTCGDFHPKKRKRGGKERKTVRLLADDRAVPRFRRYCVSSSLVAFNSRTIYCLSLCARLLRQSAEALK